MAELMVFSHAGFKGRGIACLLQVMYVCNKRIRILSLLLLLFINFAAQAAEPTEAKKDKKVAVVLSGGGAKGMAHIGVLKVIEEVGIPVDMVVGTSIGSLVGGLYAVGYNAQMLDSIVRSLDWSYLLSDRPNRMELNIEDREKQNIYIFSKPYFFGEDNHSRAGFIQGINVQHLFDNLTGDYPDSISFNELPREFACVATNLIDNSEYVFHSGVLAQAMRSSMSIPGVFAPVFKDSMVLVDGGLKNNYPVDIAREMGADYVIGVVLQGDSKKQQDLKSTASILGQLVDINIKNKYEENVANTDIYIHVDCSGYGSLSFNKAAVDTLLKRGENTARQKLDAFIALKKEIDETDASVKVVPTPSPNKVELERQESNVLNVYAGGRFDIEEMAAIQGNVTYTMLPKKFPIDIEATLRLGRRIMGRFDAAVNFKKWGKMNIAYIFRHNDINIYYAGHRDQNTIFNSHCIDLSVFTFNIKNLQISFNAKWNYTNFVYTLANTNNISSLIDDNNLHHFVYNVKFHYNSEDAPFFITRGTRFTANVGYYSDDGAQWQGEKGIFVADAMWRTTFPCGKYVGIRPMIYGRVIFGDEPHTIFSNYVGGTTFSRYFEQQMPFAGVGHVEPVKNAFIGAQLNTYVRIKTKHYIFLDFATAKHASNLTRMFDHNALSGSMLSYYYRTFLGPIGASFLYNNRSDKYYFYFTFGYEF